MRLLPKPKKLRLALEIYTLQQFSGFELGRGNWKRTLGFRQACETLVATGQDHRATPSASRTDPAGAPDRGS